MAQASFGVLNSSLLSSNEGSRSFPKGDNREIAAKISYLHLKIFSKRLANFIQSWQKYPWIKEIQAYENQGSSSFPRGDNREIEAKIKYIYI